MTFVVCCAGFPRFLLSLILVVLTSQCRCFYCAPPGLLYVILKHMVDRYNIYYAYVPTKLNQRIHRAAISQVIVAPLLCMFWLLFFSVLKLGTLSLLLSWRSVWTRNVCKVIWVNLNVLHSLLVIKGPVHPITLFTLVSLLSCIAFSLFRLCLRKQPDKSTSYQVSSSATTQWDQVHLKKH